MAQRKRESATQLAFDLWDIPAESVPTKPVAGDSQILIIPVGDAAKLVPPSSTPKPKVIDPVPLVASSPAQRSRKVAGAAAKGGRTPEVRVAQGLAAARVLQELRTTGASATDAQREVLSSWPGWGAVPQLFDEKVKRFAAERAELKEMWSEAEWNAARRTTVNAHYTDPRYVESMWRMMQDLGVTSGRVLEPGSGSGNFLAAAPNGVAMVGVELDPVTAEISQHLNPEASVRCESFADTTLEGDGFDAVIGNVPFAPVRLHDPVYNPDRFTMHNYFIVKSVALTKPGGLLAVLSSRFTMDARNEAVRARIYESADLVGAVRLPGGAHKATAGTDVITDLLVFRKRRYGETPGDDAWLHIRDLEIEGQWLQTNSYFVDNPDAVVGTLGAGRGLYGEAELTASHPGHLVAGDVDTAISRLTASARERDLVWNAAGQRVEYRRTEARTPTGEAMVIGHLSVDDGEVWAEALTGRLTIDAPAAVKAELVSLIELRDHAVRMLEAESAPQSTLEKLEILRGSLNASYDSYRAEHGAINRVGLVPIRGRAVGEEGAEAVRRKYPPVMQFLRQDPHAATVFALEVFDEESQKAAKADIFRRRVVGSAPPEPKIETAADALAVVLDRDGVISIDEVARLLNVAPEETVSRLVGEELVFVEPAASKDAQLRLVPRAEYLSGNVRRKLESARTAATTDSAFERNVVALEAIVPPAFGPAEIDVRMGATWVPRSYYIQYIKDHTGARSVDLERHDGGQWQLKIGQFPQFRASEIGTPDMGVQQLMLRVMNHGKLIIERQDDEGKKWVDSDATELLREKADRLVEHFQQWLWADASRAENAARIYNDRFNATVLRTYDDVQLSLPGKAEGFNPRPHQVAAVARMINEPAAGLFHEVGAGKTAEMVMGVMELRRLGMVNKPAIVVPNHMLDQFTREFKKVYPLARVLSAGSGDVAQTKGKDGRRVFIARAATGDWDAIIITRSAFSRVGLSPATQAEFLRKKIDIERGRLESMGSAKLGRSRVKGQEKAIIALEEKMKAAMDMPRDAGLSFEASGIDYLCVDEAHGYKNLQVTSSYEGLSKANGSQLAMDLDMKLQYLRDSGRERVVTLATATPMANGLQELYVMQSYLRPDLLEDAGLTNADEWARQFTEDVTQVEIGPAGDYRMKTRIGKFRNLPEMLTMFHVAGDVKTAKDLELATPLVVARADGRRAPEIVVIPATIRSKGFQQTIGERAMSIRSGVDPAVDNMLKLSNDSRQAALDMRLHDPSWRPSEDEPTKARIAALRIIEVHKKHQSTVYKDALGEKHPTPGGLQLVFADRGTPSEARFSVYQELKDQLIKLGMPASKVRFIHDAETDAEKDAIFAACRAGSVSVLVGSTEKMGTGTNIQLRATALHHLDCPWRPADVVQREGRVIRQGNQNAEVELLRYVQSGSFDAFMWQTVTRKAVAAEQIMSGHVVGRELEMVSDEVFSFAEAMAMSNDDPRIVARIELDSEIQRLKRLERGHQREKIAVRGRVRDFEFKTAALRESIPEVDRLLANRVETTGEKFAGFVVDGPMSTPLSPRAVTSRAEFGAALKNAVAAATVRAPHTAGKMDSIYTLWAGIGGVRFKTSHYLGVASGVHTVRFQMVDPAFAQRALEDDVRIPVGELREMASHALAIRLENKVAALPQYRASLDQALLDAQEENLKLTEQLEQPFARRAELNILEDRRSQLIAEMTGAETNTTAAPPAGFPAPLAVAPDVDRGPGLNR